MDRIEWKLKLQCILVGIEKSDWNKAQDAANCVDELIGEIFYGKHLQVAALPMVRRVIVMAYGFTTHDVKYDSAINRTVDNNIMNICMAPNKILRKNIFSQKKDELNQLAEFMLSVNAAKMETELCTFNTRFQHKKLKISYVITLDK